MKKVLSLLLAILIMCGASVSAFAILDDDAIYGGELDDGIVVVRETVDQNAQTGTDEATFKEAVANIYKDFLDSGFANWINEWVTTCVEFVAIAICALLEETIIFSKGGTIE